MCARGRCASVTFWTYFPWVVSHTIAFLCHAQTLFVATSIFAQFEDPIAVGLTWLQAIGISLVVGWFVQDPLVIVVRNNLSCTKAIIRSKKYQVVEKYVLLPVKLCISRAVDILLRLLG